MKRIVCTGPENRTVSFGYDFSPFFLLSVDGVTTVINHVVTSQNTMVDGSTYQGSTTTERNIVITAQMMNHYRENRELLYRTFPPRTTGTLAYHEAGETRLIDYKVETIEIGETGIVRNIVLSLLCPDPFFYATEDIKVEMAGWECFFEFDHEFLEPEPLEERFMEMIKEIVNDSAATNLGLTIAMTAEGTVINPAIHHVESGRFVKLALVLLPGDSLIITTGTNNKRVRLIRGGVETPVNYLLDEDSEFIQLGHGANTLKYDADSGVEYLNVSISYRYRFLGV